MFNTKLWWSAALLVLILAIGMQASYIIGPVSVPITPSVGIPKFVQTAEAHQTTTASPLSVNFGSLPAINDVVIVVGANQGGGSNGNVLGVVSDNQGNPYTRIFEQPVNGGTVSVITFWCAAVTASSGTFTVSIASAVASQKAIMVLEYAHTSCNPDKAAGASGGTSPYSCGSFTTKNAKDLLLASVLPSAGATGTVTFTAPTGFMIQQSQGVVANGLPIAVADDIVSSVGTFTPTFGASQNLANTPCSFIAMISQ